MANVALELTELLLAPESMSLEAFPRRTDTLPWHSTAQHLHSALTQQMLSRGAFSRNTEMDGNYRVSFYGKMKEESGLVFCVTFCY